MFELRLATRDDLPVLAALYAGVVQELGPTYYSPDQVRVWSACAGDAARFADFVLRPHTLVAEQEGEIVGFAGIERTDATRQRQEPDEGGAPRVAPLGHITSLYVHHAYGRQGIGARLLQALCEFAAEHGFDPLYSEASKFSRALFERFGFHVTEIERGDHLGVPFMRYLMSTETAACIPYNCDTPRATSRRPC